MEQRAFPVLLEFYREFSGRYMHQQAAAEMICRDLGVQLEEQEGFGTLAGNLWPKDRSIELAPKAPTEHRGYVIYHELAHLRLLTKEPFFARPRDSFLLGKLSEIDVKEEYWCDALATAMLFAWAGHDVLFLDPVAFFRAGTEKSRGDLEHRSRSRDMYCGQRILSLNRQYFAHPHDGFVELGNDLCQPGQQRLKTAA